MNRRFANARRAGLVLALSLLSGATLAVSCEDDEATRSAVPEAGASPGDVGVEVAPDDGGVHRDTQVLHVLLTANAGEVEHGTIAQSKATNEAVKGFAAMMISDHGAATERLQSLAAQKAISPEPNAVSDAVKAEADTFKSRLDSANGTDFDITYMDTQIVQHVKLLAIIDDVLLPAVRDQSLKDLVTDIRANVSMHHHRAQQIRGGLEPSTTRPDASTTRPDSNVTRADSGAGPR